MPHTLLLADDSVTTQRVVELTFANEDIAVIAVGDGDRAMAILRDRRPDIVLADVAMPGRNGYELAQHIKQTPALSSIPVLLMTGAFEPVDHARVSLLGCAGVLAKPIEPQALVQRVRELLAGAVRPSATVPAPPAEVTAARAPNDLDDYFDRLDQAFAQRTAVPAETSMPVTSAVAPIAQSSMEASEALEDLDLRRPSEPVPSAEPLLAGAFSALLAAEQSGAAPEAFAEWLPEESEPMPAPAPAAMVTDATIELIVQRVIERLSDRVVRDTVTAIASTTAERLVREEIERIKSNIK